MRVAKASLIGLLMEEGEEDLAVLIARSDLPDYLLTERDAGALASIGLSNDELYALLPGMEGPGRREGEGLSVGDLARLEQTVSDRWAHLVHDWNGKPRV
ncbi:hypothetical protein [Cryptosporangium sp. NPDC051539]|uniref:hypothetical protein n=1 Tax=Cryptosporangium sp. NPDC051539 TaxID=3363962 RepID=UPI0037B9932A